MGTQPLSGFMARDIKAVKSIQGNAYGPSQVVSFSTHPDSLFVIKSYLLTSNDGEDGTPQMVSRYSSCERDCVIQLVAKREHKGQFCSANTTVQGLFQYVDWSLRDEIDLRKKNCQVFSEKEVLGILQSILQGFKNLEENQVNFAYLDPEMVVITPDNRYKLCLVGMLFESQVHLHKAYIPPEVATEDYRKYRVYILGTILLECITLQMFQKVGHMHPQERKRVIYKTQGSPEFKRLLLSMLDSNPETRPSLPQILAKVAEIKEAHLGSKGVEIAKGTKEHFTPVKVSQRSSKANGAPSIDRDSLLRRRIKREKQLGEELFCPRE